MAHESRDDGNQNEVGRSGELAQVEAALSGLAPRPAKLSAARLMYLAGQESVAHSRRTRLAWLWPTVAAVATVAASIFGVLLATQPGPRVVERVVYLDRPAQDKLKERVVPVPPRIAPSEKTSQPALPQMPTPYYLQARQQAMSQGVESLPTLPSGGGNVEIRHATYRELQDRILEGEFAGRPKLPEPGFYSWPGIILRGGSL